MWSEMNQEKMRVSEEIEAAKPSRGFWSDAWQRYRRRPIGMLALGFVLFLTIVAIFAPAIAGTKPVVCSYKGNPLFSMSWILQSQLGVTNIYER